MCFRLQPTDGERWGAPPSAHPAVDLLGEDEVKVCVCPSPLNFHL